MENNKIDSFMNRNARKVNSLRFVHSLFVILFVLCCASIAVLFVVFAQKVTASDDGKKWPLYSLCLFFITCGFLLYVWKKCLSLVYKKFLVRHVGDFYHIPVAYKKNRGINKEVFKRVGIDTHEEELYVPEDFFCGTLRGVDFSMSEFTFNELVEYRSGRSQGYYLEPTMRGFALILKVPAQFRKPFSLSLRPKAMKGRFNNNVLDLKSIFVNKGGDNRFLTPDLQHVLVDCAFALQSLCAEERVSFYFRDNLMILFVDTEQNRFELGLFCKDIKTVVRKDFTFLSSFFLLLEKIDVIIAACQFVLPQKEVETSRIQVAAVESPSKNSFGLPDLRKLCFSKQSVTCWSIGFALPFLCSLIFFIKLFYFTDGLYDDMVHTTYQYLFQLLFFELGAFFSLLILEWLYTKFLRSFIASRLFPVINSGKASFSPSCGVENRDAAKPVDVVAPIEVWQIELNIYKTVAYTLCVVTFFVFSYRLFFVKIFSEFDFFFSGGMIFFQFILGSLMYFFSRIPEGVKKTELWYILLFVAMGPFVYYFIMSEVLGLI